MDIQLPGTDGITATRILRSNDQTANIPVLAVTAHAMRGDELRSIACRVRRLRRQAGRLLASSATV
jgi:CheY-like chemotaxis protein